MGALKTDWDHKLREYSCVIDGRQCVIQERRETPMRFCADTVETAGPAIVAMSARAPITTNLLRM